jgi:hypothetical protein
VRQQRSGPARGRRLGGGGGRRGCRLAPVLHHCRCRRYCWCWCPEGFGCSDCWWWISLSIPFVYQEYAPFPSPVFSFPLSSCRACSLCQFESGFHRSSAVPHEIRVGMGVWEHPKCVDLAVDSLILWGQGGLDLCFRLYCRVHETSWFWY